MQRELRLLDALDTFSQGAPILHALALTFGYDGDIAVERLWGPLVERFGVRHPLVIADSALTDAGTSLGVHVLRTTRAQGLFHPKLLLAVRDDAVLVVVGSANLTRGGLGANLELSTALTFSPAHKQAPRSVLRSVLAFLSEHVRKGLAGRVAASSLDIFDEIIQHASLVAEAAPEKAGNLALSFLHSYEQPLWEQIRETHGSEPVERMLVMSPYFECEREEPSDDGSLLRGLFNGGLSFTPKGEGPRLVIHAGGLDPRVLPVATLRSLGALVELRTQALSQEPRRLHAKLIILFGKKRTTFAWGSANFTPSALLRTAGAGGNVECLLTLSSATSDLPEATVARELDLEEIFKPHKGELPEPMPRAPAARPLFDVGEALYDPKTQELSIFGEIFSERVVRVCAFLEGAGEGEGQALVEGETTGPGVFVIRARGESAEELDPETGKRRLRSLYVIVTALDASGQELARVGVRLNVQFYDALEVYQNLLLGDEAVTPDALLLPPGGLPERRITALQNRITAWKAARQEGSGPAPRHQAALDSFFRNVRRGLDAQWNELVSRRGARFALYRWSRTVRRALDAVDATALDGPRRIYFTTRVVEHIEHVLDATPRWGPDPAMIRAVVDGGRLAEALRRISLDCDGILKEVAQQTEVLRERVALRLERLS
jgi:hypothetical protein